MATARLQTLAGQGTTPGAKTNKRFKSTPETRDGPRPCRHRTIPRDKGPTPRVATVGG